MSDPSAWIPIGMSAVAIVLGLVVWGTTDRKLAAIEEDRRAEEIVARATADPTLWLEKERSTPSSGSWRYKLVLKNVGATRAHEVMLRFLDEDVAPLLRPEDMETWLPVTLDPEQPFPMNVYGLGTSRPVRYVQVTWKDDRGEQQKTVSVSTMV